MTSRPATAALVALLLLCAAGCGGGEAPEIAGSDPERGARLIEHYGCGGCHVISGIHGADADIAPSLDGLREQRYIANVLPNRADQLARWISDPKSVDPRTLMPDLDVSRRQARDMAAYLYSNR